MYKHLYAIFSQICQDKIKHKSKQVLDFSNIVDLYEPYFK